MRRGAPADSAAWLVLSRRGGAARDSLVVHFDDGRAVAETSTLEAGVYDVRTPGGTSVIAVNASNELLPHASRTRSGPVGGQPSVGDAPSLRDAGWVYVLAVLLLCAEWLLRRQVGLR